MRIGMFVLLVVFICGGLVAPSAAQSNIPEAYYLASDANGIRQVWRLSDRQPLTNARADILGYDVLGLTVVYSSGGQLWRQVNGGAAAVLVDLSGAVAAYPALSHDAQQVAYTDGGLWLISIHGGDARLLVADTPFDNQDVLSVKVMQRARFINGNRLLVTVGRWEWIDPAVYDLNSGSLTYPPPANYTRALALSDGRLALYSDSFVGGVLGLHVASDIANPTVMVAGADVAIEPALIADVVELGGGKLRLLGSQIAEVEGVVRPALFIVDVDIAANAVTPHPTTAIAYLAIDQPRLSPDGRVVAGLSGSSPDYSVDNFGVFTGTLLLYEVGSGASQLMSELGAVSQFTWAR